MFTLLFKINGTPELSVSGDQKTLKPSRSINQGEGTRDGMISTLTDQLVGLTML